MNCKRGMSRITACPIFPHLFIYLFLNSSIFWRFSFFIYFVSLFSGFYLPPNSWLKLSMTSFNRYAAHLFLLFWRISWETATYFCFTTRVETLRNCYIFLHLTRDSRAWFPHVNIKIYQRVLFTVGGRHVGKCREFIVSALCSLHLTLPQPRDILIYSIMER